MKKNLIATAAVAALTALSAQAAIFKDVVRTEEGKVIHNTFSNCVLTKWDSKTNDCKNQKRAKKAGRAERTIFFNFGSDELTTSSQLKLDALARKLEGAGVSSVKVVGYADQIGDTASNEALSDRRAKAVEDYLRDRVNLPFRNREVRGLGESNSRTQCSREQPRAELIACLADDRRVEVELKYSN